MPETRIDGIHYELREAKVLHAITAYDVYANGKPAVLSASHLVMKGKKAVLEAAPGTPRPLVAVVHHGGSGPTRWTLHAGGKRYDMCNQQEVFEAVAKLMHG